MPVKIIKEKPFKIRVEDEVFKCKHLPEQDTSILRAMIGTINEDGDYEVDPRLFTKFCYRVAHKVIIGWENVTNEDTGEAVKFSRSYIKGITELTIVEFGQKWMMKVGGAEEIKDAEVKNSKPTSPSEKTSPASGDVVSVEKSEQSTD